EIGFMKCPACFNQLTELQVGRLEVDACQGGCAGIWFDAFELQQVDEKAEHTGDFLLDIQRDEKGMVDPAHKREWPRCAGIKLKRHLFSTKSRVEVDECPNCGGYWLDAGELAKIREEHARAASATAAQSALSSQTIRYLYRLRSEGRTPTDSSG